MPYPPNLCTSVQSVGVFVGGYGIPAIPTLPSEFLPQDPLQVCLRKSSHRIHRIHRSFRRRIFSHRLHRIHRSFWRRRASHRCAQMVRLRRVLPRISQNTQKRLAEKSLPQISQISQMVRLRRLLWEDSFVAAWVWQGCHTLLICAYPCNLWENTLRQKLLWVLWLLWEDSLVAP